MTSDKVKAVANDAFQLIIGELMNPKTQMVVFQEVEEVLEILHSNGRKAIEATKAQIELEREEALGAARITFTPRRY